jgi:hypothetical protein
MRGRPNLLEKKKIKRGQVGKTASLTRLDIFQRRTPDLYAVDLFLPEAQEIGLIRCGSFHRLFALPFFLSLSFYR